MLYSCEPVFNYSNFFKNVKGNGERKEEFFHFFMEKGESGTKREHSVAKWKGRNAREGGGKISCCRERIPKAER